MQWQYSSFQNDSSLSSYLVLLVAAFNAAVQRGFFDSTELANRGAGFRENSNDRNNIIIHLKDRIMFEETSHWSLIIIPMVNRPFICRCSLWTLPVSANKMQVWIEMFLSGPCSVFLLLLSIRVYSELCLYTS